PGGWAAPSSPIRRSPATPTRSPIAWSPPRASSGGSSPGTPRIHRGREMDRDQPRRSIVKMLTWRLSGSLATVVLVLLFTHEPLVALSIGGLEVIAKMALYFVHERIWERIRFGRRRVEPVVLWFTGLSGAGKSTLAERVHEHLRRKGYPVELLDGDAVRS